MSKSKQDNLRVSCFLFLLVAEIEISQQDNKSCLSLIGFAKVASKNISTFVF